MRTLRTVTAGTVLACATGTLAACGAFSTESGFEESGQTEVQYATRTTQADPLFAYWTVAEELGYFEEEGISSTVVTLDSGEQAVQSGRVELTVAGANNLIALQAESDKPSNLISIFSQVPIPHYVYAVLPDSPVQQFAEIKGKTIGVPDLAHSANLAVQGSLAESGLNKDDVEIVAVEEGPAAAQALRSGDVDMLAYHDTAVITTEAVLGQQLRTIPLTPKVATVGGPLMVARRAAVNEDTELYVGYLRAFIKGWIFANANPQAAMKMQLDRFPEMVTGGQSRAEAMDINLEAFQARNQRQQVPDWGEPPIYGWHYKQSWLPWKELIPGAGDIDMTQLYTNKLVRQAWEGIDEDKIKQQAQDF